MPHPLVELLDHGAVRLDARWTKGDVQSIGTREAPDDLLGTAGWLLKGDLKALWGRWMADGLCDPRRYPDAGSYPRFVGDVRDAMLFLNRDKEPRDEVEEMAAELAQVLWQRVLATRPSVRRAWQKADRDRAWDQALPALRCWICGHKFLLGARQGYRRETVTEPLKPWRFVDVYAPRGLHEQDLRIEIDHVVAVAAGGKNQDDIRLACGWCNRYKSSKQVLYDAAMELNEIAMADGERRPVPPPFWVVRLLALRGRCEWPEGCDKTTRNAALKVAPRVPTGAPTPTNLWVTCSDHDPLKGARLIARSKADKRLFERPDPTA